MFLFERFWSFIFSSFLLQFNFFYIVMVKFGVHSAAPHQNQFFLLGSGGLVVKVTGSILDPGVGL